MSGAVAGVVHWVFYEFLDCQIVDGEFGPSKSVGRVGLDGGLKFGAAACFD